MHYIQANPGWYVAYETGAPVPIVAWQIADGSNPVPLMAHGAPAGYYGWAILGPQDYWTTLGGSHGDTGIEGARQKMREMKP